jgi:hypothetical protein
MSSRGSCRHRRWVCISAGRPAGFFSAMRQIMPSASAVLG